MADRGLIDAVHQVALTASPLDRLTAGAVKSITLAGELAQHHGSTEIETTHLLLALASNDGVA